jgi:hypothetical protein
MAFLIIKFIFSKKDPEKTKGRQNHNILLFFIVLPIAELHDLFNAIFTSFQYSS